MKTRQVTAKRIKTTGKSKLRWLKLKRSHLWHKKSKWTLHARQPKT